MEGLKKILEASLELFTQYGFKAVTMDDIARRAGISKKTLYQHFTNKDEVVRECMLEHQRDTAAYIDQVSKESANAIEAMVRIMSKFDNMFRNINPLAFSDLQRFFSDSYKLFRDQIMLENIESMSENMQRGIDEGHYREDINVDLLARYRMESCMILFQPTSLLSQLHHPHTVNNEISEHFLYGIMTPKGEKLYQKYKDQYFKQTSR